MISSHHDPRTVFIVNLSSLTDIGVKVLHTNRAGMTDILPETCFFDSGIGSRDGQYDWPVVGR